MENRFGIKSGDLSSLEHCPCCISNVDIESEILARVFVDSIDTPVLSTAICMSCGLVFRNVRPKYDWYSAAWEQRQAYQSSQGFIPYNEIVERRRESRYGAIARALYRIGIRGRVVDFGTGTGLGLRAFNSNGFSAIGVEPDGSRACLGLEQGLDIFQGTAEEWALQNTSTVELYTLIHSLEHFHEIDTTLLSISRVMEVGSHLYIEVPDFQSFVSDWNDALFLGHLTNFSFSNLISLAGRFSLRPVWRVFPRSYLDGPTHLAVLFVKVGSDGKPSQDPVHPVSQIRAAAKNYYSASGSEIEDTLDIKVPFLNDLSLLYKPEFKIDSSVEKNQSVRGLLPGDNGFEVVSKELTERLKVDHLELPEGHTYAIEPVSLGC